MIITSKNIALLKKAYDIAVASKKEEFTFQGEVFATSYAKYLLEFLETQVTVTNEGLI
tara:strand:- start:19588 stop:19761 length:174 start_codon:yes stop_codon:yes gene_type:complete